MKPLALAIGSALLQILVFPRFDLTWLAPLCLVPLILAIASEPSAKRRIIFGLVAGVVYWCGICYWIAGVLGQFGGMHPALVGLAFFLFTFLRALPLWVGFSWLGGYVVDSRFAVLALAVLWTGLERVYGPFSFAWLVLGNAGIDMSMPMRLAPFTGVYGLSFVFAMMNVGVALAFLRRPRRELIPLLLLPLLYLLPALPPIEPGNQTAVAVQPNIQERADWTADDVETTLRRMMLQAMEQTAAGPPQMILWPEVPAPFYDNDPLLRNQVTQLTRVSRAPLLMGVVSRNARNAPLNSVLQVSPDGGFGPKYDKVHLVPFGETTPEMFSWIGKISSEAGSFAPGDKVLTFPVSGGNAGAFICYESVFPHYVRQFVEQGANVLVNLSNDGYFSRTSAREQHLLLVRMRAAENRRWVLRATNDGITASIDPAGRLDQRADPFKQLAVKLRFQYRDDVSLFTRYGDWFAWACLVAGLAACAASRFTAVTPSSKIPR